MPFPSAAESNSCTHLVLAGLIIFSIPIIDTILAIVRRRIQGQPMWDPDAHHMHHVFKRRLGSVKSAVLAIYGMGICFAMLGAGLGYCMLAGIADRKIVYLVFIVLLLVVVLVGANMGLRQRAQREASA